VRRWPAANSIAESVIRSAADADSEGESFSSVPEQRARSRLIEAQSTAIARAMASICNDEQVASGVMSGHD
jgi:hypothetical protein